MSIKCYIVDDEFHSIEIIRDFIEKTPGLELMGYSTDPLRALEEVTRPNGPDLIFLDIDMPEISGMEFAGMVSFLSMVIFTTSFRKYALEAFERDATDYLLKPIVYSRFLKAITRVRKNILAKEGAAQTALDYFYIKTETKGKLVRIDIGDIRYIEALLNYVRIHLSKEKHIAYLTIGEVQEYLPQTGFSRIHKSYIIADAAIKALEPGQVILNDNLTLPLGRAFKEIFLEKMYARLFKSRREA